MLYNHVKFICIFSLLWLASCSAALFHSSGNDPDAHLATDAAVDAGVVLDAAQVLDAATDSGLIIDAGQDAAHSADAAVASDAGNDAGADASFAYSCQDPGVCDDGLSCTQDSCDQGICHSLQNQDCDWPSESSSDAENLTSLGGSLLDNPFGRDMSGASWNPLTQELWICRNNGPSMVWMLRRGDDGEYYIPEQDGQRAEWSEFGDAEGLTMGDFDQPSTLYLIQEGSNEVVQYDLSTFGVKVESHRWHTGADMPNTGNNGAEGIAFVPNAVLQRTQAVDDQGQPLGGTQGLGGIMLVAHQNGGGVYAYDLNPDDDSYIFRGVFQTALDESAGLEVDRDTGLLYIWHGANHNSLEVTRLSSSLVDSHRILNSLVVLPGPSAPLIGGDNFEGIALEPLGACVDGKRSLFLTIDGGRNQSLFRYRDFICPPWGP